MVESSEYQKVFVLRADCFGARKWPHVLRNLYTTQSLPRLRRCCSKRSASAHSTHTASKTSQAWEGEHLHRLPHELYLEFKFSGGKWGIREYITWGVYRDYLPLFPTKRQK